VAQEPPARSFVAPHARRALRQMSPAETDPTVGRKFRLRCPRQRAETAGQRLMGKKKQQRAVPAQGQVPPPPQSLSLPLPVRQSNAFRLETHAGSSPREQQRRVESARVGKKSRDGVPGARPGPPPPRSLPSRTAVSRLPPPHPQVSSLRQSRRSPPRRLTTLLSHPLRVSRRPLQPKVRWAVGNTGRLSESQSEDATLRSPPPPRTPTSLPE